MQRTKFSQTLQSNMVFRNDLLAGLTIASYEAPTQRRSHASPRRRRIGHGHLPEAHTTRCRKLFFLPDTAFSLDAEKIRLWCCKKWNVDACCRVARCRVAVAELPVAELPPNSRRGEGRIEDRKGKVKQNKKKSEKKT